MGIDRVVKILPIYRQKPVGLPGFYRRKPERETFVEPLDYN